jgi:error-prone DNA polymerase
MYAELHCHSHYSLLDGASAPEALVARAVELGLPALALTDHDGLYGAVAFWRAARAQGVQPIIGAELTLAHGSHLTLLAENQAGYANLSRLISRGQLAGSKRQPVLTIEEVAQHTAGLLCLTGCRRGAVAQAVLADDPARAVRTAGKLADIFGRDRVWVELQRHWLPDDARLSTGLVAAAQAAGLPVVATNNVHYATPAGQPLHDLLTATRLQCALGELTSRLSPLEAAAQASAEFHLKRAAEMTALFADLPAALRATLAIAERCRAAPVSLDFAARRTPAFPPQTADCPHGLPAGETAFSYLYALAHAGLVAQYRPVTPHSLRQLSHELSVIEQVGLADYFLIVWDIVRFARSQDIRCQGRGSAANSLVAYVLGITPVDPLAHHLLFERFLSERSDTTPDIDLDFAASRRDEVIAYVYQRYGGEHTALVCNVNTYQWRSAVRDTARALGFTPEDVDRVCAWARHRQPGEEQGRAGEGAYGGGGVDAEEQRCGGAEENGRVGEGEARGEEMGEEAGHQLPVSSTQLPASSFQLVTDLAAQLVDTPRHLSVHVGGMLVTAQPLVEIVPLEHATKAGVVVAQWNKDSVADAGLIKIDLLCLRTLDAISEACELIAARTGQTPDMAALPLDDPCIYAMLAAGDTIGAFQVESRAQAQMLPRLKPARFEDLVIQVAIVRPGPIQGGMVHPYLRRRQGLEPVTYLHPNLEPFLAETLGVVIFQEQVLQVAMALARFAPGEADLLRRAMSRSRSAEAMAELRERFIQGALANGVAAGIAAEAFRQLQGFATYGFCKSHATAFALLAYQTLWLKQYHPLEFTCALLNHQPMGFYAPEVVIGDAQRHGVTVLRPDVNLSQEACTLEQRGRGAEGQGKSASAPPLLGTSSPPLRLGLRYLHGLGEAGSARILAARDAGPFTDLGDFCRRTRLPRALIGDLIRAGALDSCQGSPRADGRRRGLWQLGETQYEEEQLVEAPISAAELPELSDGEACAWDYELLGMTPGDHPLRLWRPRLQRSGVLTAAELNRRPAGQRVRVAGLVIVRQAPPTAKGHLFITLEDETGLTNLIVRPDLVTQTKKPPSGPADGLVDWDLVLAEGMLQRQGAAVNVVVTKIRPLTSADIG